MHFLLVVFVFPLLLWALSLGCGLLVERLSGLVLPALLIVPLGFGALIVVSQFTTWKGFSAPLTPWILIVIAAVGFAVGWRGLVARWSTRPPGWWFAPLAPLGAYLAVVSPVLAAARLTFPGYLIDTTGAIQLAGAERLLHHGRSFALTTPDYGTQINGYFGSGYPSGSHSVLGSVGWLTGQDLLWLITPFQAAETALSALVLVFLARRAGLPRLAAAVTGLIAALPALTFSYALMGSIKEQTVLPLLLLMGALIVLARELRPTLTWRAVIPFGVAGAGALGAIGIAASPWVILFGTAALLAAVPIIRRRHLLRLLLAGGALAAATALLALPTVGPLPTTLGLARGLSATDAAAANDPGNLLRPLKYEQALGVWLGESHRFDPKYFTETYLLMGVVLLCLIMGLLWLVRRRAWPMLAFFFLSVIVFVILTKRGTEWTDAKLLVLISPVVMLVALVGAFGRLGLRTIEAVLLSGAIAVGVIASDALNYHGTNMAPTARFVELRSVGQRFQGQGPTLIPDFDEYAVYLLRTMQPDGPGLARSETFHLVSNAVQTYGRSYDLDSLSPNSLRRFKLIVMRRSPSVSRPPGNYALAWQGQYYTVWRRAGPPPAAHVPLGDTFQAAKIPACRVIQRLATQSGAGAVLRFAQRPLNAAANLGTAVHSPGVVVVSDLESQPDLEFATPGRVQTVIRVVRSARYQVWLGGDVDRALHVVVDGHQVGAPAAQSGGDGNSIYVGALALGPGEHVVDLLRYGGTAQPGDDARTSIDSVILEPVGAEAEAVQTTPTGAWRSLCGRPLDWIELP